MSDVRIPIFQNEHAIESLRASDFDIPTAIGELVDNSIQASSTKIKIRLEDETFGKTRPYKIIQKIICGDDGEGMDAETLQKSIVLGYSSRYNDRTGIGRFGVGMTLAAIRFATKIEIYSKSKKSDWNYISFDLTDEKDKARGVGAAIKKNIPKDYSSLVGSTGTLVIWSNLDNERSHELHSTAYKDGFDAGISLDPYGRLNHWLGRTYRQFIWQGVQLFLNDQKVYSFDPLFINKKENQFSSKDTSAELVKEDYIDWIVPKTNKHSRIKIRTTLLPIEYRRESGRGGEDYPGRYIDENEGISILRNNREVLYNIIPRFGLSRNNTISWDDAKNRWWSTEISFSAELDECFTIKNIKHGATPDEELKEELYRKMRPVIETCIERVQSEWTDSVKSKAAKGSDGLPNSHQAAEKLYQKVKFPSKIAAGADLTQSEEEKRTKQIIEKLDAGDQAKYEAKFQAQPFTIMDENWKGDVFVENTFLKNKAVLQCNLNHPFFVDLRLNVKELETTKDLVDAKKHAKRISVLLDILLMSYVRARQSFGDDDSYTAEELFRQLLGEWGRYLKSYTEAYKKDRVEVE